MILFQVLEEIIKIPATRLTTGPKINMEKLGPPPEKNMEYRAKGKPAEIAKNTPASPATRTKSFLLDMKSPTHVYPKRKDANMFVGIVSIYI